MRGGGWRSYDRMIQRDLERAAQKGPEEYERVQKNAGEFYATAGGGQAGAVAGGVIGTIIAPGVGTVIGAAIGGVVGFLVGKKASK